MIKVNLLTNAIDQGGADFNFKTDVMPDVKKEFYSRIFILIVPIVAVFAFRQFNAFQARSEVSKLEKKSQELQVKLKELEPAVKEVEKFKEEKKKLDSQLDIIKQLSKERLKNVKSLDALQNLIPQKAWLTAVKVKENKVEMDGLAIDDIVISEFMQALENSIFYANVGLVNSEEYKKDLGTIKKFTIKCNLENL